MRNFSPESRQVAVQPGDPAVEPALAARARGRVRLPRGRSPPAGQRAAVAPAAAARRRALVRSRPAQQPRRAGRRGAARASGAPSRGRTRGRGRARSAHGRSASIQPVERARSAPRGRAPIEMSKSQIGPEPQPAARRAGHERARAHPVLVLEQLVEQQVVDRRCARAGGAARRRAGRGRARARRARRGARIARASRRSRGPRAPGPPTRPAGRVTGVRNDGSLRARLPRARSARAGSASSPPARGRRGA